MYMDHDTPGHLTIPVVVGGLIASYFAYSIGVAIYNITFHPLAKFPGPKLRGAFDFPDAVRLFTGDRDHNLRKLHDRYGKIVRLAPNKLSFTTAQAWKDIYGFRVGKSQLRKDPKFYSVTKYDNMPPGIISDNDADHNKTRRLLSNAFSDNALRGQEQILNEYFELLVSGLKEQVDEPNRGKVNMVAWYNWTTFDIIGDLAFGESFHALENHEYHPWISAIFEGIKYNRVLMLGAIYPWFKSLTQLATKLSPSIGAARAKNMQFTREKAKARLASTTDRNDFIGYILRGKGEKALDYNQIIVNSRILVIAGSETTATLLSGVTYHLLINPSKLARLQNEVRGAFSSPEEMSLVAVGKLPFLQAVLEEALRVYPPVASILPRITSPGGDVIDGTEVPGNVAVGVHQISANRSKHNWADPDAFVPERWLHGDDVPERYRGDQREAMQPFSTGPRNCLGKNLAYNEMRAILARMVWHFDMELMPESQNWSRQKTWLLWQKRELMVQLSLSKMAQ